jgi:hypothetical protein
MESIIEALGILNTEGQVAIMYCTTIRKPVVNTIGSNRGLQTSSFITRYTMRNHYERIGDDMYSCKLIEQIKEAMRND